MVDGTSHSLEVEIGSIQERDIMFLTFWWWYDLEISLWKSTNKDDSPRSSL